MQENIFEQFINGNFANPHSVLGLQKVGENKRVIRVFRPGSESCEIEVLGKTVLANKIHEAGFYEYEVTTDLKPSDYRIYHKGGKLAHDPYAFELTFGELDIHLLSCGLHYELYNLLGSTIKLHQGIMGTNFAVWAPNALSVSLVGEFNHWNGRETPMRSVGNTGVWEIFLPGVGEGENYKFEILTREGKRVLKSDPVGHYFALRPDTSSIVFDIERFSFTDSHYLEERKNFRKKDSPINVYEVHLGSWKRKDGAFLNYRMLATELAQYAKKMHFTHVELMGICEHPLDESWGYQVTGYFGPTSRYGTPEDFQYLVNYLHQQGIGVILDWVPAHFPTDDHSLFQFDGTYLYEHKDPRQGFHPQWNTHIFNYGRWEVSNFLIANALFWIQKMHVDGLRVDAVASMLYLNYGRKEGEWIPNSEGTNINLEAVEFLKHLNSIIHKVAPDVLTIAEESTSFPGITKDVEEGGLGFDLKWNLGWMNDTLSFFQKGKHQPALNHVMDYAFEEKFILPLSHDEVVHEKKSLFSKMPGNEEEKFANLRTLLSFMFCTPGKNLLFMGGEIGQLTEWNPKEEIHWHLLQNKYHQSLQKMVGELGKLYLENSALHEKETLQWVHTSGPICYFRKNEKQTLLCLHNFSSEKYEPYHLPVVGKEIFSTDREEFGGSGIMNETGSEITVPPLSTLIFHVEERI